MAVKKGREAGEVVAAECLSDGGDGCWRLNTSVSEGHGGSVGGDEFLGSGLDG